MYLKLLKAKWSWFWKKIILTSTFHESCSHAEPNLSYLPDLYLKLVCVVDVVFSTCRFIFTVVVWFNVNCMIIYYDIGLQVLFGSEFGFKAIVINLLSYFPHQVKKLSGFFKHNKIVNTAEYNDLSLIVPPIFSYHMW